MTFGGMGSQKLDAPNIEYIVNNDTHPGAQFNGQFRSVVKNEVARLAAQDGLQTAQAKMARSSPPAKLSPPKEVRSTALAFANADSPKHEPKPAQTISASRPEQTRQQQKPPAVFADVPKPQPIFVDAPKPQPIFADASMPQPVFADAFLTSANTANLFVQRTLTISDMKEYVKRTYPNSQAADLIR
jgi:hypothetical protein